MTRTAPAIPWTPLVLAAGLWAVMFGLGWGGFWPTMTASATLLALLALWHQRAVLRRVFAFRASHIVVGVLSAALLYAAFLVGDRLSALLFGFAAAQINDIYAMKAQTPPSVIAALLFLVIGPAEEMFWRGFVQDRLAGRLGPIAGWLVASLVYAGVHLWSWNFMLAMAALCCGLFWGAMYLRYGSLLPGIISHAVWDVLIFVVAPLR